MSTASDSPLALRMVRLWDVSPRFVSDPIFTTTREAEIEQYTGMEWQAKDHAKALYFPSLIQEKFRFKRFTDFETFDVARYWRAGQASPTAKPACQHLGASCVECAPKLSRFWYTHKDLVCWQAESRSLPTVFIKLDPTVYYTRQDTVGRATLKVRGCYHCAVASKDKCEFVALREVEFTYQAGQGVEMTIDRQRTEKGAVYQAELVKKTAAMEGSRRPSISDLRDQVAQLQADKEQLTAQLAMLQEHVDELEHVDEENQDLKTRIEELKKDKLHLGQDKVELTMSLRRWKASHMRLEDERRVVDKEKRVLAEEKRVFEEKKRVFEEKKRVFIEQKLAFEEKRRNY